MELPVYDVEKNSKFQAVDDEYKPVLIWCVYVEGRMAFEQARLLLAKYCRSEKDFRFWVDTCAESGRK